MRQEQGGKSKELVDFLSSRRWFGGKGRTIRDAELADVIPVKWPNSQKNFAVARVRVTTDGGTSTYQLFLTEPRAESREPRAAFTDALEDPEFRRGLADAFLKGCNFQQRTTHWVVESESAKPLAVPPAAPVTLASSEQTNSSVIIDGEAILKLYRKLESGVHPDVEVTRFLTIERQFAHVPVLLGTIRFEDGPEASATTAGMLQELVPGAVDGWTYALGSSAEYFRAGDGQEPALPFEQEAQQLGVVTRALHETLASGDRGSDFEFRPASPDDIRQWVQRSRRTIEDASRALERALQEKRLPQERASEAKAIVERRPGYLAWMSELDEGIGTDAGANVRTHGDYHLGQVLRSSGAQFLVIDFEGEPTRPLSARRARHSPLRDVAGMLRSFSYAAAVGGGMRDAGSYASATKTRPASKLPLAEVRAARWERSAREAFLRGYFSEKQGNRDLLPRSHSNAGRLIALFEAEKVFYELQYELDHRPEWVWIPLRGIAKLYT